MKYVIKEMGKEMIKVITIDGLASSGKSTLSQLLAQKLNWSWLSTGVLYRGMAYVGFKEQFNETEYLQFFQSGKWHIELTDLKSLFFYKGKDISSQLYAEEVDDQASLFSSKTVFRKALIPFQRAFYKAQSEQGLILEGRDCGTVLFPSAPLKIFLSAGEQTRAERRAKDRNQEKEAVFEAQKKRDKRDQNRFFAPLIPPENSWHLDTSQYNSEELAGFIYEKAQNIFSL